jgi:hypothetical protein
VPQLVRAHGSHADVLWDQFNPAITDFDSQDFEYAYDAYDIYAGDDFKNAEAWTIESIVTAGGWGYYVDLNNAIAIHCYLYLDVGGVPAGVPGDGTEYWSLTLPPYDPQVALGVSISEDVVLSLDAPIRLPEGHWWLVYFVSLEYGLYGQWGWSGTSDVVWGDPGMQNNR